MLDATNSTHFSRFFNHEEFGNLNFTVNPAERRVDFYASTAIPAGDELTFDYLPMRGHQAELTVNEENWEKIIKDYNLNDLSI